MKNQIREQDIVNVLGEKYGFEAEAPSTLHIAALIKQLVPVINEQRQGEDPIDVYMDSFSGTEVAAVEIEVTVEEAERIKDMFGVCYEIMDVEHTGVYESFYEVASDVICLSLAGNSVDEAINMLKKYTKKYNCTLNARLRGAYPCRTNEEDNSDIHWNIVKGVAFGGGKYELPLKDENMFIMRAFWLHQLSPFISLLNESGITIVFGE